MRFPLLLAGLAVLPGCAALGDIVGALEPVLDVAVNTAANSAASAVEEQLGNQWGGTEIAAATATAIAGLWGSAKAALYAWNREPKAKA